MRPPALDMTDWSILDFEMALIGVRVLNDAAVSIQNQPRSSRSDGCYTPGSAFIVEMSEDYFGHLICTIVDRLEVIRFDDSEDEERRINLWLSYWTSWGSSADPLDDVLAQVAAWRAERS